MTVPTGTHCVIPTLDTDRLTLSAPQVQDFEGYAAIVTTQRGMFIGGPFDRETAWLDFSQMIAGWILRGFGVLTIRHRISSAYLGSVLVHHEFEDPEPELGWLLVPEAEGQEYAFEAGSAMRDWAFEHTSLTTLVSYIDPGNTRAITLARRLGGRLETGPTGVLTYRHTPLVRTFCVQAG